MNHGNELKVFYENVLQKVSFNDYFDYNFLKKSTGPAYNQIEIA